VPLRSKKRNERKEFFQCNNSANNLLLNSARSSQHRALWPRLYKKAGQQPGEFLTRHVNREWGDLSDEDRKENDYSLEHGFRLLSAYRTHAGDKLWIITESDRSVTTLLLPEEY
jgi:superoxide dismutase